MARNIEILEAEATAVTDSQQKVDALNNLVWELAYYNPQQALHLSQKAHKLATTYHRGQIHSLLNMAHCYNRLGHYQQSIQLAQQVQEEVAALDEPHLQAKLDYLFCCVYWDIGSYHEATEHGLRALVISRALGDPLSEAQNLNMMGLIHHDIGALMQAVQYFEQGLALYQAHGFQRGIADVIDNLSHSYREMGDYERALTYGQQSLQLHQEIGYKQDEGIARCTIGQAYQAVADWKQAQEHFHAALQLAREVNNAFAARTALLCLGELHHKQRQYEAALGFLRQALSQIEPTSAKSELSRCHQLLAQVYRETADFPQAFYHLEQHHRLREQIAHERVEYQLKSLEVSHRLETAEKEAEIYHLKAQALEQQIAERQKAEEALRFQKILLEAQQETMLEGILIVSPERQWLSYNRRFLEIWHIPEALAQKGTSAEALAYVRDQLQSPDEFIATIEHLYDYPQESSRDEIAFKDGRIFARYSSPVYSDDGTYFGRAWYYRDVTERRQAQTAVRETRDELAQRVIELSAINHIAQTLSKLTSLHEALENVAKDVTHLFNGFSTGISLFNEERTTRTIVTMFQMQDQEKIDLIGRIISIENDVTYHDYIAQGKSLIIPDPQTSPYTTASHRSIRERNLHCLLLIPLRTRGDIIGTISLSTNEEGRVFSQDEVGLAETIATQIAVAVDNARLFDQEQQRAIEMAVLYEEAEAARTAVEESAHAVELANQALAANVLELQSRNEELDAFAHTVAHDLKSPLGSVVGYAEWLMLKLADISTEEAQTFLSIIMDKAQKIKEITDSLLLLATTRREDVTIVPLDMDYILMEVLARLSADITETQAEINLPETWPVALGYASWIEEIWVNYIGNALKYGGDPPCLELGAEVMAQVKVRFWVRDNGAGLTKEQQKKLFMPFTRLHIGWADGHGLGLSIVQRIIEQLGGEVGVESVPGEGSTFFFTLPAAVRTE